MSSLIYNYYRKKDEKDSFVPKMPNGGAYILESVDASPFFGFGDVKPGETMQVLYNNLFRAPIFHHNVPNTDFLCIRFTNSNLDKQTVEKQSTFYERFRVFMSLAKHSQSKKFHVLKLEK